MLNLSKIAKTIITRVLFIVIFVLLGLVVANQYVLYSRIGFADTADDLGGMALRVARLYSDNEKLKNQIEERQKQLNELQSASTGSNELRQLLERDQQKYKILNGEGVVEGSGVIISIKHIMVLTQLIDFVNALKNSGAEAISINEKRFIVDTALNEFNGKDSFLIKAIGEKEVLYSSLTRPGGIFELIMDGSAEKSDNIVLPKIN
jgi:uncharacterized protein YlxW (UPF0749 family)